MLEDENMWDVNRRKSEQNPFAEQVMGIDEMKDHYGLMENKFWRKRRQICVQQAS